MKLYIVKMQYADSTYVVTDGKTAFGAFASILEALKVYPEAEFITDLSKIGVLV